MPSKSDIDKVSAETSKWLKGRQAKHVKMVENSIQNLQESILTSLDILKRNPDGKILGMSVNLGNAQKIHTKINQLFEKDYSKGMAKVINDFKNDKALIKSSFKALGEATKFTDIDETMMKVLRDGNYQKYLALGKTSQDKVTQEVYNSVIAGGSQQQLSNTIRGALMGSAALSVTGVPLANYSRLYARDMIMNYHNDVILQKGLDLGMEHFKYMGTLMAGSRRFCKQRVGLTYTKEEINSWKYKWQGKAGPAMTYRGGYNCRHHWQPVRKEWLNENELLSVDKRNKIDKDGGITHPWDVKKKAPATPAVKRTTPVPDTRKKIVLEDTPITDSKVVSAEKLREKKLASKPIAVKKAQADLDFFDESLVGAEMDFENAKSELKKMKTASDIKRAEAKVRVTKSIMTEMEKDYGTAKTILTKAQDFEKAETISLYHKKIDIKKLTTMPLDEFDDKLDDLYGAWIKAKKDKRVLDDLSAKAKTGKELGEAHALSIKAADRIKDVHAELKFLEENREAVKKADEARKALKSTGGTKALTKKATLSDIQKSTIAITDAQELTEEAAKKLGFLTRNRRDVMIDTDDILTLSQNLKNSTKLHMNAPLSSENDFFKDLFENGQFKNQFERGRLAQSGGHLDPRVGSARDDWEKNISNGILQKNKVYKKTAKGKYFPVEVAQERPIYGYLSDPSSYNGARIDGRYGKVTFVMKDDVKARTTLFKGNTSGFIPKADPSRQHVMQSPTNNTNLVESLIKNSNVSDDSLLAMIEGSEAVAGFSTSSYTEAQMYGGLNLARDVEEILVYSDMPHIKKLADKWGIKYRVASRRSLAKDLTKMTSEGLPPVF